MDIHRRRLLLASLLAAAGLGRAGAAERRILRLGLMPVYGLHALIRSYEPMRAYLSRLLSSTVRIETAPDFKRYLDAILAREFDIAVAAAHFARIAQLDSGWHPLAQFEPDHDTLLIAPTDRMPGRISDLAGKEVAVIDRMAITVTAALDHLEQQGLAADRDYRVQEYRTHSSVVHSLLSGASALAVTTTHGLRQLPTELRTRIAVYRRVSDIPAFVILASPDLPSGHLERLRKGILAFPAEAEGRTFFAENTYTGLHAADEAAMRRADRFLKETRRTIGK